METIKAIRVNGQWLAYMDGDESWVNDIHWIPLVSFLAYDAARKEMQKHKAAIADYLGEI